MEKIIFLFLIPICFSYLIFPLNKIYPQFTSKDNQTDIIKKLQESKLYITINIGSEKTDVKAFIILSKTEFFIAGKNVKNHKYNESASESYNCTNKEKKNFEYCTYKEGILSTDNFNIKNDKNEIETFNNVDFILGIMSTDNEPYEAEIGLHSKFPESIEKYNFILSLKRANATKSYNWYLDFDNFSNGGGKMVIDGFPHDLDNKKYKKDKFTTTNALNNHIYYIWGLKFSSIYYNESIFEISKNLEARFEFDMGLVSAPYEVAEKLQNSFFSYYMMKNICFKAIFNYNEYFYYCKNTKEFNPKDFKSIYFKSQELEIIFELDYEDLFYYKDDYIYFLVTFKDSKIWILGEVFLKKYYIVINQDLKTVGYYQGMEKVKTYDNGSNFDFKYFFIILILILILISIIIVGIIYYRKKGPRKNRANELEDDDYSYMPKNDDNDNKNMLIYGNKNIN